MIGTTETPTPPLVDLMTYIDFNPYWTLPPSIAKQEYLPKLQKNAEILDKYNMKLYYGKKEINPKKINWKKVKEDKFVYTIRQLSGKTNSLGRVKFVFPNNLHIYLHDTHARHLFKKKTRAYSHGCIRVQAPLDLAEELLSTIKKWDRKRINNVIKSEKHERIILEHQIPVYLIYLTLYVSPDGELHEYDDIYDRENELIGRLRKQLKT